VKLAAIIPYYQREAGLLRRCLESVAGQQGAELEITAHVVDDGSPAPSLSEVEGLACGPNLRIDRLVTANQGAPAARNTALDRVGTDTDFVAFLDSDDVWAPDHLARAVQALGSGFDVYFSDHARTGSFESYFDSLGLQPLLKTLPRAGRDGSFLDLQGADVFGLLLRHYLAQSSTVVFRRSVWPQLRFDESLRTAGEDHLFWLKLATRSQRFCLSTATGAVCGQGVSIYYSSFDWTGDDNLYRVSCLTKLYEDVGKSFSLSAKDRVYVQTRIRGLRSAMAFFLAHTLLRKKRLPRNLASVRQQHPHFWWSLARDLPLVALAVCLGRYRLMAK
jgi:succinoglycan biosynthesis protein ExoW